MKTGFDLDGLRAALAANGAVVRVLVAAHRGSVPRETGIAMLVWADGQSGTIGGGALEFEAAATARAMLSEGRDVARRAVPLGPALRQCCGGHVELVFERFAAVPEAGETFVRRIEGDARCPVFGGALLKDGWLSEPVGRAATPLWLYGAGHVGRAVVQVFAELPFVITWVDDAVERFPDPLPDHVAPLLAADPAAAVARAPDDALHIVLTYSHALDLDICHAVLSRPHAHLGLIGSETKAARFRSRLAALGHDADTIARLHCPIGNRALGKAPAAIAVGLAAELLQLRNGAAALTDHQG
ncbi:xanthine dehydrogenase accessory protein XdhC [Pontivivens ytuae]|uniref:Xanthine dehydrogenase accessory protein XdhC n=1 Tax=Pontivivens ytuae TaxID=2789856 RepID=A0A7S9LPS1_9RHOB|nr:xanthine dehydrogenase accessory protein XdhC [Pontivivens ytuae]QPH52962.1 xanthine dehydrogenase accessory protein XdhC [Pontivivens ytuae]